jgi:hypothetical protein
MTSNSVAAETELPDFMNSRSSCKNVYGDKLTVETLAIRFRVGTCSNIGPHTTSPEAGIS